MNQVTTPVLSIVTVCFNAKDTLEQTMLSVFNQTYKNIEYIIIDGGSNDGTIDVIHKYKDKITYWVSEKDNGIYDAMNKGALQAKGDYLQFLNSGDWLSSNTIIEDIFSSEDFNYSDVVYGDMIIHLKQGIYYAPAQDLKTMNETFPLYHPSTFVSREIFLKYLFDTSYIISADYKLLRDIYNAHCSFNYVKKAFTDFDGINGVSSNLAKVIYKERARIMGRDQSLSWKISYLIYSFNITVKKFIKSILNSLWPDLCIRYTQSKLPSSYKKM